MQLAKKTAHFAVSNQQEAIILVTKFVDLLSKESKVSIQKAILFGSFAKNEQHEYSDIDLALWSNDFTGVGFLDYKIFSSIKYKNKIFSDIECHTFSPKYPNPFEAEILKMGVEINLV
jgi:predicted nucleotidyltransferase